MAVGEQLGRASCGIVAGMEVANSTRRQNQTWGGVIARRGTYLPGTCWRHRSLAILCQWMGTSLSVVNPVRRWQAVASGQSVEMENFFSRLTLDIIGKAVFNYDFDSLTHDDPIIEASFPPLMRRKKRRACLPIHFELFMFFLSRAFS